MLIKIFHLIFGLVIKLCITLLWYGPWKYTGWLISTIRAAVKGEWQISPHQLPDMKMQAP